MSKMRNPPEWSSIVGVLKGSDVPFMMNASTPMADNNPKITGQVALFWIHAKSLPDIRTRQHLCSSQHPDALTIPPTEPEANVPEIWDIYACVSEERQPGSI